MPRTHRAVGARASVLHRAGAAPSEIFILFPLEVILAGVLHLREAGVEHADRDMVVRNAEALGVVMLGTLTLQGGPDPRGGSDAF